MRVTNLTSPRTGAKVANQFEIVDGDKYIFQSYDTVIAIKEGRHYTISGDYNYSNTTSRYFGQWLRSWGWHDSEIVALKIWLKDHKFGDKSNSWLGVGGDLTVEYVESL